MTHLAHCLTIIYIACAVLLAVYGLHTLILILLYLRHRPDRRSQPPPQPDHWPTVVVQLPIFNEAHVVRRLIDPVTALDYPRDRLSIQVLDDSTDYTAALVQARVEACRTAGVDIRHVRRPSRQGYKAGALAYGLKHSQAEVAVVLDADFVPAPDFLRQTIPYLVADPRLGVVQARWGHINPEESLLTRAQALSIDMHFMIEQAARSSSGLTLAFSGSGGVWRRACIDDAGGWQDRTLTEDMDLSYRAQLRGWRVLFLPHVVVSGELPPQVAAYKRQQARWAKGTTQCLVRMGSQLLHAGLGAFPALMGFIHLCQYLVQPIMLLLLLLTVPLMLTGSLSKMDLSFLGVFGSVPVLAYTLSQRALYSSWPLRSVLAMPALLFLGAGTTVSNTAAVCSALLDRPNVFLRTPKFGQAGWQSSSYALLIDKTIAGELALAVYAGVGVFLALQRGIVTAVPLFALYALASGATALATLWDARQVARAASARTQCTARISNH